MKNEEPKFDEFPETDYQTWKQEASRLLKGENPEEQLHWSSASGIELNAYYDQSDVVNLDYIRIFFESIEAKPWIHYERIVIQDEKEANAHAKNALMSGCEGVLFKGDLDEVSLDLLLSDIFPEHCFIGFENEGKKTSVTLPSGIKGFGENLDYKNPDFRNLVIRPEKGDSIIDKSVSIIKQVITLLENEDPAEVLDNLVISLQPGNDFFHEIARLRAFKILLHSLAHHSGVKSEVFIHAEPLPGNTESDHLLRQTTTGLACIIGGANSIAFHPGKSEWAGNGAHRVSRNIGNLIRHEAKLTEIKDFSNGSYFIDALTDKLAKAIWNQVTLKK